MNALPSRLWVGALAALALVGCDDEPSAKKAAPTATTSTAQATAPASVESPKPKGMPELLVDSTGPYLGGRRADPATAEGRQKLTAIIQELPIQGNPVTLAVDKHAKVPHVATVVAELGRAGAPKVIIKTDGRDDVPKEITVTPETKISAPMSCSVATMILADFSTAVWSVSGGLGKRQRKGLAGPDLTATADTLKHDVGACDSKIAFFSAEDAVSWENAYNLAGTLLKSDEKKHIDTLVLLKEAPVAGRPVNIGK